VRRLHNVSSVAHALGSNDLADQSQTRRRSAPDSSRNVRGLCTSNEVFSPDLLGRTRGAGTAHACVRPAPPHEHARLETTEQDTHARTFAIFTLLSLKADETDNRASSVNRPFSPAFLHHHLHLFFVLSSDTIRRPSLSALSQISASAPTHQKHKQIVQLDWNSWRAVSFS